jgi:hypothetical protein
LRSVTDLLISAPHSQRWSEYRGKEEDVDVGAVVCLMFIIYKSLLFSFSSNESEFESSSDESDDDGAPVHVYRSSLMLTIA